MLRIVCAIAALSLSPIFATPVHLGTAGSIVRHTELSWEYGVQYGAMAFILNQKTQLLTLSMGIDDYLSSPYTFAIQQSLYGLPVWQSPTLNTSYPTISLGNLILNPGVYYIVGPTSGCVGCGWVISSGIVAQQGGTVANGYYSDPAGFPIWYYDAAGTSPYSNPLLFDLTGVTVSAVPEPLPLFMLFTGAAGTLRLRRTSRR